LPILLTGLLRNIINSSSHSSEDWMIIPTLLPDDILEESGVIHHPEYHGCDQRQRLPESKKLISAGLYHSTILASGRWGLCFFKKNKKAEAKIFLLRTQIFHTKLESWSIMVPKTTVGKLWLDLNPDSSQSQMLTYRWFLPEASAHHLRSSPTGNYRDLQWRSDIFCRGIYLLYAMYSGRNTITAEEAVKISWQKPLRTGYRYPSWPQLARFRGLTEGFANTILKGLIKGMDAKILCHGLIRYFFNRAGRFWTSWKDGLAYEEELTDSLKLMREGPNLRLHHDWSLEQKWAGIYAQKA